jgi:hypothetical protein
MYVFITTKTAWATLWAIFSLTHPVTLNHGPRVRAGQVQSKSTDTATWAGQIFSFSFFSSNVFYELHLFVSQIWSQSYECELQRKHCR